PVLGIAFPEIRIAAVGTGVGCERGSASQPGCRTGSELQAVERAIGEIRILVPVQATDYPVHPFIVVGLQPQLLAEELRLVMELRFGSVDLRAEITFTGVLEELAAIGI